ncbi:MAG: glycerophosphodiester phosphodiesterase [Pseudomonadota bacterium]
MTRSLYRIWWAILEGVRSGWRPLLTIHLVYAALGFVLLVPLTGVLVRFLIGLSGHTALADQDIAWFLVSPLGVVSLVVVAAVLIAIAALESASLMATGAGLMAGRRNPTLEALAFATRNALRILLLTAHLVARILLLAAPFLATTAAVTWFLITDHDINYYLQAKPREFWLTVAIVGVLLIAMLVVVVRKLLAWSLVLVLVLFMDVPPTQSFAESARFTRGNRPLVLNVMLGWAAVVFLLGGLILGLVQGLGSQIVPFFYDSLGVLVVVLGAVVALWSLANLLITAFNAATFALAIVELSETLVPGFEAATHARAVASPEQPPQGFRPGRIAIALIAGTVIAGLAGAWLVNSIEVRDKVTIVAHRGAAGKAPENTMASVRQAIEDGADWVEIDVQETADGEVVVIHDSDFMKLAGVDLKVWDGTLEQVSDIDIGSWFAPAFSDERVPTLSDVLVAARGKSGVVIELKYYGHDEQLEQRVVDIVEELDMVSEVGVMSLKYEGIQKVRALRPNWTIGLLSATAVGDLTRLDADFLAVNMGMATPGFVRRARDAGKQVFVWTVNDAVSMSRMMSIGVDGIITDEPEIARQVLEERKDMGPAERLLVHTAVLFGRPVPPRAYRDDSP